VNQEVAYLLKRIESFDGVVILASNLHRNLDEAFRRRFEVVVYFPPPRAEKRLRLWREGFSPCAVDRVIRMEVHSADAWGSGFCAKGANTMGPDRAQLRSAVAT
jgi:SpoVK/Ycf46/Vps4 family AAA+-type ATPase